MKHKRLSGEVSGRRKFLISLASLAAGSLFVGYQALSKNAKKTDTKSIGASHAGKSAPKPNARLGINFSGIAYWASEFPFVDLMHQSGPWVSQPPSGDWGAGPQLALDAHGWVKKLAKDCRATKIICAGGEVAYPSGTYVVLYDGEGDIELTAPIGVIKKTGQGRLEIEIDATKGMLAIDVVATNPQNHLRNIRVIVPGFESSCQTNPWHPDFLKRWAGVACIRLMDMMATNNSTQEHWQDRPKVADASYAEKGVPAERLVDLANRLDADVWFCMPHQASDAYIKQFAIIVEGDLKPNLRAWLEYSNEVWNGGFDQYGYAAEQGQALKLADDEWNAAFHYNAHRSVAIFKIWQKVFENHDRIVNVIASQAANAYLSEQLLNTGEVAAFANVLAIAPYVSMNVPITPNDAGLSADKVAAWPLDKLFEYLNTIALPESKKWIEESKKAANRFGVQLVAYEGGQHLVGIQGAENNDQLGGLLMQANADKKMGDIYTKNLTHWQAAGGDLMCTFTSVEGWSKWGSWGLLQHAKETASDSPKFKAVMDWAKSRGQKVSD